MKPVVLELVGQQPDVLVVELPLRAMEIRGPIQETVIQCHREKLSSGLRLLYEGVWKGIPMSWSPISGSRKGMASTMARLDTGATTSTAPGQVEGPC